MVSVCARATTDVLVGQDFKRAVSRSSNWLLVDCSFKATFEFLSVCMAAQLQCGHIRLISSLIFVPEDCLHLQVPITTTSVIKSSSQFACM